MMKMDDLKTAQRCAAKMFGADKASQALGLEVEIPAAGEAVATMRVRDDMVNGFDVCHGGLLFALADSAFAFACNAYDRQAVAASAQIEFLRPSYRGDELEAVAKEDYRGRRNAYYTVTVRNQNRDIVCLFHGRSVANDATLLDSQK